MRTIRRIISLTIVAAMLLSINGTAAVITDNDASAFVTKAEFEAIKNNVQGQIDAYINLILFRLIVCANYILIM